MILPDPLPDHAVPLLPGTGEPAVTAAWAAHLDAGRLGAPGPHPQGPDFACAGLAAALGWASPAGRFVRPGEAASGGDVASSLSTSMADHTPTPA